MEVSSCEKRNEGKQRNSVGSNLNTGSIRSLNQDGGGKRKKEGETRGGGGLDMDIMGQTDLRDDTPRLVFP